MHPVRLEQQVLLGLLERQEQQVRQAPLERRAQRVLQGPQGLLEPRAQLERQVRQVRVLRLQVHQE